MTANHRVPRLNPKLANFKLCIGRSRIERYGVFAGEAIPARKRVIQYTGERIRVREALRRAIKMLWAGKAGRIYTVRLNRRWKIDGSVGGSGAESINHSCKPNLTMRKIHGQIFLYSFKKSGREKSLLLTTAFGVPRPVVVGPRNAVERCAA
jgi:uncharacterized protein